MTMTQPLQISRSDFKQEVIPDPHADTSFLHEDADRSRSRVRLKMYSNGLFAFCGVRASVEVLIPYGRGRQSFISHTVKSPGLWGIEDDCGADYLKRVFEDEADTLARMLTALGCVVVGTLTP
jgi:hypothetical protein